MHRRGAVANRVGLAVLGLVLVIAGGVPLAEHWRLAPTQWAVDAARVMRDLPWEAVATPWAMAVAGGLVAVLGALWLLHQFPRRRPTGVLWLNRADAASGTSTCHTSSLHGAIEDRVGRIPGVVRATALVTETPTGVDLALEVAAEPDVDLAALRAEIAGPVVSELAGAVERTVDRLSVRFDLAVEPRRGAEVRLGTPRQRSLGTSH